jgi:hypothetical protein
VRECREGDLLPVTRLVILADASLVASSRLQGGNIDRLRVYRRRCDSIYGLPLNLESLGALVALVRRGPYLALQARHATVGLPARWLVAAELRRASLVLCRNDDVTAQL